MNDSTGDTAIHRRVAALREGRDPTLIARLASGWAVLGEHQFLPGYSLVLPDPVVPHLNALPADSRATLLADVSRLGDALLAVTGALRINYAIFGNLEPALHVHLVPRHAHEPEDLRTAHPWSYDWTVAPRFDAARDGPLVLAVRQQLQRGP